MRQIMALMWKEWRENLRYLVLGFVVYLGPSVLFLLIMSGQIGHSEAQYERADMILIQSAAYTMSIGMAFGGLFSILFAVGAVCRDFQGSLDTFWRSRPVYIAYWVGAKYLSGALVLLVLAGTIILYSAYCSNSWSRAEFLLLPVSIHLTYIFLLFSLAFLLAALIRNATRAAILSIAGGLIIYFLPLVFPPLSGLSVFELMPDRREGLVTFWLLFSSTSVLLLIMTGVAIQRDWRLDLHQKGMAWVTGAVALLLFSGAAFQVGSNLECERIIPLNEGAPDAVKIVADGNKGIIGSYIKDNFADLRNRHLRLRTFDFSSEIPKFGSEIPVELGKSESFEKPKLIWSLSHPQWIYLIRDEVVLKLEEEPDGTHYNYRLTALDLLAISLDTANVPVASTLALMPYLPNGGSSRSRPAHPSLIGERIYIHDYEDSVIVDVSNPLNPTIIQQLQGIDCDFNLTHFAADPPDTYALILPAYEELTPGERLALVMKGNYMERGRDWDGQTMVLVDRQGGQGVRTFSLEELGEEKALFTNTGQRRTTALESFFSSGGWANTRLGNRLVYVLDEGMLGGLTVYDIRDPSHIRRVGHYAAPNERFGGLHVLPDGRILLAGQNLHIVKPPRLK